MTRGPSSPSWRELDRALADIAEECRADSVEEMTGAELYIACLAGDIVQDVGVDPEAAYAEYKRRIRAVDSGAGGDP